MEIKIVNDKSFWENFVLSQHPNKFLQSWFWGQFQKQIGNQPFYLGFFDHNQLQGVALVVKESARRGAYFSCADGPLIDWQRLENFYPLLNFIKKLALQEKVNFLRIRPPLSDNLKNRQLFQKFGFRPAPLHLHAENTWVLDLTPCEEELLMTMRKNNRYAIRKAQKEGVIVFQSRNLSDMGLFYQLQMETVRRQHFVPFSKSYLQTEFASFQSDNQTSLFFASYQKQIIAGALIIFYGDQAFYHYAARSSSLSHVFAPHLLVWEAILEAKKRGCQNFNFWGMAPVNKPHHPWQGLSFFKKGFGGQAVDYLHAQDLPFNHRYYLTYFFETLRRLKRGL